MPDPAMDDPDAILMRRTADGDAAAFRQLVDRHADRLLAYSHRLVGERSIAEDVVQDTYLSLWRTAARWTPAAKVSTWLYRVARNAALDRIRRRRPSVEPESVTLIDPGPLPDAALVASDRATVVRIALDGLPERQREAIILVHYEGLSGADASAVLEVSVEALESLLSRGRRNLRQALSDRREELLGETP